MQLSKYVYLCLCKKEIDIVWILKHFQPHTLTVKITPTIIDDLSSVAVNAKSKPLQLI